MSKMVQIRNVPNILHAKLKSRAALAGMSLSDYLLDELRYVADKPTLAEMYQRLSSLPPVKLGISPAQAVREERDNR